MPTPKPKRRKAVRRMSISKKHGSGNGPCGSNHLESNLPCPDCWQKDIDRRNLTEGVKKINEALAMNESKEFADNIVWKWEKENPDHHIDGGRNELISKIANFLKPLRYSQNCAMDAWKDQVEKNRNLLGAAKNLISLAKRTQGWPDSWIELHEPEVWKKLEEEVEKSQGEFSPEPHG